MFLLMVPVHNLNSGFFFLIYMPGNRNMDLKLNCIFLPHHMAKKGIGGTVKRAVWRHVRSGHAHVSRWLIIRWIKTYTLYFVWLWSSEMNTILSVTPSETQA